MKLDDGRTCSRRRRASRPEAAHREARQDQRGADAARRALDGPSGQRLLAVPDRHRPRGAGARSGPRNSRPRSIASSATNDELITARDAAERANRFKTRFFTAVGHDLLQPLHAARLSLSAMAEATASARSMTRLIGQVDHALSTIEELLRTILDLSKLEVGTIKPASCRRWRSAISFTRSSSISARSRAARR